MKAKIYKDFEENEQLIIIPDKGHAVTVTIKDIYEQATTGKIECQYTTTLKA